MSYQQKPSTGALFKNNFKKADNHPDYKGTITLPDGTEMELAAWIKDSSKGKFFSLKLSDKYEKGGNSYQHKPQPSTTNDMPTDDLPF